MNLERSDWEKVIEDFRNLSRPTDRYSSFDYCYNFFRKNSGEALLENIEMSCLELSFYLASWGMFRGSSFLLNKSASHFQPLIKYIASLEPEVFKIDAHTLRENIETVLTVYKEVQRLTILDNNRHLTLVTKIMLGVFGSIPAFDEYFCNSFREISGDPSRFKSVDRKSLEVICDFYDSNAKVIDSFSKTIFTIDFKSGKPSDLNYTRSKIIDMYGFTKGLQASEEAKRIAAKVKTAT